MTSLDDLLDRGDGRVSRPRGQRRLLWGLKATVAAAALGAALVVVLLVIGVQLWYPLAAAAILAALVLHRTVAGLRVAARRRPAGDLEREPDSRRADGLALAVHEWHARLRWDRGGRWRSGRTLQPSLRELVDERLRLRHGCSIDGDPARARALLGERLWSYLADPAASTPSPRELAALLSIVEEL